MILEQNDCKLVVNIFSVLLLFSRLLSGMLNLIIILTLKIIYVNSKGPNFDKPSGNVFKPKVIKPEPWVKMSQGAIWPRPAKQSSSLDFYVLDQKSFQFQLLGEAKSCEVLQSSLKRFNSRAFPLQENSQNASSIFCNDKICSHYFGGVLNNVNITFTDPNGCEKYPHEKMDEKYEIQVTKYRSEPKAHIESKTCWGVLRALETFTQLIYSTKEHGYLYQINFTDIEDFPKFPYRGVMLDSARHFLSTKILLNQLDLMEMNKVFHIRLRHSFKQTIKVHCALMANLIQFLIEINKINVFHWHMTDDESFPFQSKTFPNLSKFGAFDPVTHVYSPEDVRTIIEQARIRGIRVIPEFDTPGHTKSWGLGHPRILSPCKEEEGLLEELVITFPDKNFHIGGDEVNPDCWQSNENLSKVMETWGMSRDYKKLESFYIEKLQELLIEKLNRTQTIVWQESFDIGANLQPNTIVQVWKGWVKGGWQGELKRITEKGHYAILSAPWYLNYHQYGSDWVGQYKEASNFESNSKESKYVLGGEVCLWGEFVNSINAIPRLWPRASAAAEVLWSPTIDNLDSAASRLQGVPLFSNHPVQEHECRMIARGYPVQPVIGPGFCHVNWNLETGPKQDSRDSGPMVYQSTVAGSPFLKPKV